MPKDDRRWGRSLKAGEVTLDEIRELTVAVDRASTNNALDVAQEHDTRR